ncbi:MAG TPA: aminopeptidase, partial [Bacteroidia bacterium]|nr:aminopeptidase [Bacteroidia bacterium]
MRFRYVRIFFSDFVLLPVFAFCLLNADLVTYGICMGKGQMDIVLGARDFQEVYADDSVDVHVKERLRFIEEVREFAFDSIGLTRNDNYTTYYDQKGQRLLYVVTASKPFELKAHLWSFPILGDVPYKGFFNEEKANAESERLKAEGWDVDIGGASGWSTLGWFKDPVLSGMLRMSEGELAELIIHELTHGTIFVKDNVDYNENLAQFVGVEGAKWFLASRYGKDSDELSAYVNGNRDGDTRTAFML